MGWLAELRAMESGLYVWAVPDQQSVLNLQLFECFYPEALDYNNTTEYHATVLHCRDMSGLITSDAAEACLAWPLSKTTAVATPTLWKDHKDRWIIVALLKAPELEARNKQLQASGLPHSYPEYNPHITLGKVNPGVDPNLVLKCFREMGPIRVRFDPLLKYSFCG